ncbi:unnamed protein product [Camellia sinensis]
MKPQTTLLSTVFSLFFFFFFFFILLISAAADISPGSTLYASNPNQTWTSPNNTFSLRFISHGGSTTHSAAITFDNIIPVWIAGGDSAAADSDSSLQFLPDGNLRLLNGSSAVIWQSNTAGLGVSSAAIDDSGNFVLRKGNVTVWSTFDNPTDTILPNQNFTPNQVLRSGFYSFNLLSSGDLILRWNDSIVYWNSGLTSSINNKTTNLTSPSLVLQSIGILSLLDQSLPNPVIVAYTNDYAEGSEILRFLKLDSDGNLRIYSSAKGSRTSTVRWAALSDQCQVFGYCGDMGICSYNGSNPNPICGCPSKNFEPIDPKDSRKGCKRKVEIKDCGGNTTMLELENTRLLTYPPELDSQVFFVGITACRLNCVVSRSCVGSTSLSDGSGLCYFKTIPVVVSGYQSPIIPSTSFLKICGPVMP